MDGHNAWVAETLGDCGIALLGFADVRALDSEMRRGLPYGISFAIALDNDIVSRIPDGPSGEYFDEYRGVSDRLKRASDLLVSRMEARGFRAVSISRQRQNEDFRTPFPLKTLATASGLGWIGRSATLVTRTFGNAIRLGGVLTDMPVAPGVPVRSSSCGDCTECVAHCPGHAIRGKLWDIGAERDELLDAERCKRTVIERGAPLGITEGSCGICLAVCPWTKQRQP